MLSFAEENYLKAIYHLSDGGKAQVSTNSIADHIHTKAASVSDMVKRLAIKKLVSHKRYQGVNVTSSGKLEALKIIRKHRLWEVFLVQKLKFHWDEVHEVAEQLEHIKSPLLIERMDEFLGYPKYDPHGDPIPDENGKFEIKPKVKLGVLEAGKSGRIVAVDDSSSTFLKYLDKIGAYIGARITVLDHIEFDGSLEIEIDNGKPIFVSREVAENILVA